MIRGWITSETTPPSIPTNLATPPSTALSKATAKAQAKKKSVAVRDIARFKVQSSREASAIRPTKKPTVPARESLETVDEAHTIFLGNIPPNTSERDIIFALKSIGTPETVIIPRLNGLSKGYAFVEFEESQDLKAVLNAKIVIGGRHLAVRRKLPRKANRK